MFYGYNLAKPASEPAINVPMIYLLNFGATYSEMKDIYDYQSPNKPKKKKVVKQNSHGQVKDDGEGFIEAFESEMLDLSVSSF